jgi:hypothetical protein
MSVMHVTNATGFPGGTRTDQLVVWDQRGPIFPASASPKTREADWFALPGFFFGIWNRFVGQPFR